MSEMTISWIKRENESSEFECSDEFNNLKEINKIIVLSKMLEDLEKVRTHMLIVCFFAIFSPERDREFWGKKISAFQGLLTNLGLIVPDDFQVLAMEHLRGISFHAGITPCLICDRWYFRKLNKVPASMLAI